MTRKYTSGAGGAHFNSLGRPGFCMGPENDRAGGGGSGGSGAGTGEGGEGGKKPGDGAGTTVDDLPKSKKELNALISQTVNSAFKGQLPSLAKLLAEHMKPAAKDPDGADPDGGDPDGGDPDTQDPDKVKETPADSKKRSRSGQFKSEFEVKLEKTNKELAEHKKMVEEERKARIAAENEALRTEERNKLSNSLQGHVKPEVHGDVVELLMRQVVRDPTDRKNILWKGDKWRDLPDYDNTENYLQFETGLEKWLESAKGKAYAPARPVGGTGQGRPGIGIRIGKGDEPASDAEVGAILGGLLTTRR